MIYRHNRMPGKPFQEHSYEVAPILTATIGTGDNVISGDSAPHWRWKVCSLGRAAAICLKRSLYAAMLSIFSARG